MKNISIKKLAESWGIAESLIIKDGDNIIVGGSLYMQGTAIISLPDNLTVGGSLHMRGTAIASIPDNLIVGGDLYMQRTRIKAPVALKKPSANLSLHAKLSVERRFNARGYTIADGILARLLSKRGDVQKVRIVGKSKDSYLVTDGNGNYAHGETIKKAREDLVYKAVAKFYGELPKEAGAS